MKRFVVVMSVLGLCLIAPVVWADGTPAGTAITNQATATFTVGTTEMTVPSNEVTVRVAELLDVSVVWQDAAAITVSPGDSSRVLTFLVTNTGNGTDDYTLTGLSNGLPGDQFDPALVDLYLDANSNGVFDPFIDDQYIPGINDPTLDADATVLIFSLNHIPEEDPPGTPLIDGDLGHSQLMATSNTGVGPPGTVVPGAGEEGTDAVVGESGGNDTDVGIYVVSNVVIIVTKSAVVSDPWGGDEPVPGAVIAYTLVVVAAGSGTAQDVTITDAVPEFTTYNPGSVTFDSFALTDAVDADAGHVTVTLPRTVSVAVGDLNEVSPHHTITFDVTID